MAADPLWITEEEVVSLVDLPIAIAAIESFLRLEADGQAETMAKAQLGWGSGHTLHALGAVAPPAALVGTKTWAHTNGGATPLLVLWDSESGRLRAVIEAFALGQLRTASMSGVATRWLAAPDAQEFAIVGSGKQAMPQVAAVFAVRPVERVRVYSPTDDHRRAFAESIRAKWPDVKIVPVDSLDAAVAGAQIVTTATRARDAFLSAAMLASGAHVNAIGAISPDRRELHGDVLERCDLIVADSPSVAKRLSIEFESVTADVTALSAVVAAGAGRPAGADLTVFKAMGIGLADIAVDNEVLMRAEKEGLGRAFSHPERHAPSLGGGSS